jgi:hypothetical protein
MWIDSGPATAGGRGQFRHGHYWRHGFSRRRFLGTALATLALPSLAPAVAHADSDDKLPNPIKGGTVIGPFGLKHFYFPTNPTPIGVVDNVISDPHAPGDPSTIRDFSGIVAGAEFPPTAVVTNDPLGGKLWGADVRFMQGQFVDRTGRTRHGTLAFI